MRPQPGPAPRPPGTSTGAEFRKFQERLADLVDPAVSPLVEHMKKNADAIIAAQKQKPAVDALAADLTPPRADPLLEDMKQTQSAGGYPIADAAWNKLMWGLSVGGGATAMAAIDAASRLAGKGGTPPEDWQPGGRVIEGRVDTQYAKELLKKKFGAKEGGHLSDVFPTYNNNPKSMMAKKGPLDPSFLGVMTFLGQTLVDPVNKVGSLMKALAPEIRATKAVEVLPGMKLPVPPAAARQLEVASEATRPIGNAMQAVGKKIYKGGWKNIDEAALDWKAGMSGKRVPPSEVAWSNDLVGGEKALEQQTRDLVRKLGENKKAILEQIPGTRDPNSIFTQTMGHIVELRKNGLTEAADELEKLLNAYQAMGPQNPARMGSWQRVFSRQAAGSPAGTPNLYKNEAAYSAAKEGFGKMAADVGADLTRAAEAASPELATELAATNKTLSPLLGARKPLRQAAKTATKKNMVSAIDGGLIGATGASLASGNPKAALYTGSILGLKKAAQYANSPAGRTRLGILMKKMGASNAWDNLAREMLVQEEANRRASSSTP